MLKSKYYDSGILLPRGQWAGGPGGNGKDTFLLKICRQIKVQSAKTTNRMAVETDDIILLRCRCQNVIHNLVGRVCGRGCFINDYVSERGNARMTGQTLTFERGSYTPISNIAPIVILTCLVREIKPLDSTGLTEGEDTSVILTS